MNKSDYEKVGNKIYEALATELPRGCRFWFLHDKKKQSTFETGREPSSEEPTWLVNML